MAKRKKRVKVPYKDADELLVRCKHLCCICEKPLVQIHHIDGDPSNNDPDNIIPLCGSCHNLVVAEIKHVRGYTDRQLKIYREKHIEKYNNFPSPNIIDDIKEMKQKLYEHDAYINERKEENDE